MIQNVNVKTSKKDSIINKVIKKINLFKTHNILRLFTQ